MRLILTANNSQNIDTKTIEYRLQHPGTFQRLLVNQFSIWNTFDNINEYYRFIQVSVNNGPAQLITLDQGVYTATSLQQHVQQALSSVLTGISVSISNNKYVLQAPQPFKFVKFGDYRDTLVVRYLGFSLDGPGFSSNGLAQVAQEYLNVSISTAIHMNIIAPHSASDNKNICLSIPLEQATYSLETYQSSNDSMQLLFDRDGQHINRIQFQLLDDNLLPLKINQQFHVNIMLN